jgi:cytochrome c-type biogenesis protein CcmH
VLLKPRLSWHTAALWGLPGGVLLVGLVIIVVVGQRRGALQDLMPVANLTAAEESRLAELLRDDPAPPT